LGFLGQHQPQQPFLLGLGQLGQQVGSVVGPHGLEDVCCALTLEGGQDLDLLLFG
jgi:hypothetical protein